MQPVDLRELDRFVVTDEALSEAEAFLQEQGADSKEGLALLGGRPAEEGRFILDLAVIPDQKASPWHVRVDSDAFLDVERVLLDADRVLAVQIHSHPHSARHTGVDHEDGTLPQAGSFSVVTPDYARRGLKGWPGCAVYRRTLDGWSPELSQERVKELFEFPEDDYEP